MLFSFDDMFMSELVTLPYCPSRLPSSIHKVGFSKNTVAASIHLFYLNKRLVKRISDVSIELATIQEDSRKATSKLIFSMPISYYVLQKLSY